MSVVIVVVFAVVTVLNQACCVPFNVKVTVCNAPNPLPATATTELGLTAVGVKVKVGSTVKVHTAAFPEVEPATVIVCAPATRLVAGMLIPVYRMMPPLGLNFVKPMTVPVVLPLSRVMAIVSPALNPEPVRVIAVPSLPEFGETVAFGVAMLTVDCAVLPDASVRMIVCGPSMKLGSANVIILAVALRGIIVVPSSVRTGIAAKPVAAIETVVPGAPEAGETVLIAATDIVLKLTVPSAGVVTSTMCCPALDGGTVNVAAVGAAGQAAVVPAVTVSAAPSNVAAVTAVPPAVSYALIETVVPLMPVFGDRM